MEEAEEEEKTSPVDGRRETDAASRKEAGGDRPLPRLGEETEEEEEEGPTAPRDEGPTAPEVEVEAAAPNDEDESSSMASSSFTAICG